MIIASYGGGTNSTAYIVKKVMLGEPIDLIIFADTGGEKPHTYSYIPMFSEWLVSKGYPPITVVKRVNDKGEIETLEEECLRLGNLPSIVFGKKTCSQKHKIAPQNKYINSLPEAKAIWKAGRKIVKYIGYDADEEYRVKPDEDKLDKKYDRQYPLIEWDMDRAACIEVIKSAGLPLPGKSACYFCPSSKRTEIRWLHHNYPDLAERALAIEANGVGNANVVVGLGRNWRWQDVIHAEKNQIDMLDEDYARTPELLCGCID